jgi:hypothetical protein
MIGRKEPFEVKALPDVHHARWQSKGIYCLISIMLKLKDLLQMSAELFEAMR